MTEQHAQLARRIDIIERGYEYLPAFAAQGRRSDAGSDAFIDAVRDDALKARGALAFTLNCSTIGSQLIDNLNASIHVRALLTDLFLVDQALRQATV